MKDVKSLAKLLLSKSRNIGQNVFPRIVSDFYLMRNGVNCSYRSIRWSALWTRVGVWESRWLSSTLTLIRDFWIKNPKRGTVTERVSRKKFRVYHCIICISSCALEFSGKRARWRYQKSIYLCSARHFFTHIGICHFKLASLNS